MKNYSSAEIAAIRKKEEKNLRAIKKLEKVRDKELKREKLTPLEEKLSKILNSYSFHFAAKEAIKRGLIR